MILIGTLVKHCCMFNMTTLTLGAFSSDTRLGDSWERVTLYVLGFSYSIVYQTILHSEHL